jgi:hypothetical protein
MNTYTNTTFTGFWPVGTSAVVRASSPAHAADMLNAVLKGMGLQGDVQAEDMKPWPLPEESVRILQDGNY